jgi:hypothetical protein
MVRNQRDASQSEWTVTNWTSDLTLDCDGGAIAATDDVLGTLIKTLIENGTLNGTVSA